MIKVVQKSTLELAGTLAELEKTLFTTSWDREIINNKINKGEFIYWVYEPVSYTHLTLPTKA